MGDDELVIVGGGLAGAKAAEGARSHGWDGRIRLVGDEHRPPYERPHLSKEILVGTKPPSSALVHDDAFYATHEIDVLLGAAATGVALGDRAVELDGGRRLRYDKLVLATGSTPRRPPIAGVGLDHVYTFRTLDDVWSLKDRLLPGHRVAVVGASWIGTETAACARQRGCDVVMIDPSSLPLERVLGAEVGSYFARLHTDHGVELFMGRGVAAIDGAHEVEGVRLDDGTVLAVDTVVLGVGVTPNIEMASAAGLDVDDGVLVDSSLVTSHPDVYAAGDIANAAHPVLGRRVRVEHWANALHQGLAAGANAAGASVVFDRIPYFYSDQYDMGMEYSGWPVPWDDVVFRGDPAQGAYVAFYLAEGRLVGGANVNVWDVNEHIQALIRAATIVDIAVLTNANVEPAEWATAMRPR